MDQKVGGVVGIGYLRPDQFLDHLTVIITGVEVFDDAKVRCRTQPICHETFCLLYLYSLMSDNITG